MPDFWKCQWPACIDDWGRCTVKEEIWVTQKATPGLDNKDIPSPPVRCSVQYEADVAAGIQRIGKPTDKGTAS